MNVGDWIDSPYSEKGHRLSADREDAICGFPLVVGGFTDGRLKANTAVSRRCTICKKHDVDRLGLNAKDSTTRNYRPTVGKAGSSDRQAGNPRRVSVGTTAPPISAREQAARRDFELVCARVQREFEGSEWV